ncbi:unnamed protein product [Ectocarpus sp. CCAP 1310/34]|nr:unnamed protein product [Ectocarpus sp. CCAP 1310/34]
MAAVVGTSCIPPPVSTGNPTAGTAADAGPEGGGGPSTPSAAAVNGGGDCNGFNVKQQPPSAAANGVGTAGRGAEVLRREAGSSIASAAAAAASSGKTASRSGDSEDGGDVADACATQTSAAVMPADGGGDTRSGGKTGGDDDETTTARSSSSTTTMAPPPPESTPTALGRTLVSLQLKKEELLPPPVLPPSACTTPAESPRNPDLVMDAFRSPSASPWPAGGGGGGGGGGGVGFRGRQGGASAAAVAAGARSGGGDRKSAWRPRTGSGGGGGGGSVDAFCVSPISPRVSPRALMSSPVGIDGPARDGSFSLSSSPSSQRGAFAGSGRLEGSDWWKGLDLSPDRCGLPRWRESRKPLAVASSLPSDIGTEKDGGGKTAVGMTAGAAATGLHDGGDGVRGLVSPTSSSSARMSRSYMTLLAAAAAEETTKGRRQQGGGVPGRGAAEVSATEQAFQPLTVEGRLRQLEAENLRLRFRVADLEGQVSVMEDELDRRGVARPMIADANSSSNTESCRTGNAGTAVVASAGDNSNASPCRVKVEATGAAKTVKAAAAATAAAATSPKSRGVEGQGGGEAGAGMVNDGPLLSPRGRGYLARLVLEVCSEIEDSKKAATEAKAKGGASTNTVSTRGEGITSRPRSIPHSERLCKVLPKVMETAIRGVKDLDEQVFEQMMRTASERSSGMSMSMSSLSSPAHGGSLPLGTPARRLSSCVVARDGGGEFFAQSPAPGRPASFFRLMGEPKTPARGDGSALRRTSSGSSGSIKVVRTASPWDATPMKKILTGGKQGKKAAAAAAATPHRNARETPLKTPRSGGAGGFFGAGDWLAAAFTPRGALAPDPESPRAPASEVPKQQQQQQPPEEEVEKDEGIAPLAPAQPISSFRPPPEADALSFEGSTEEVLRYTIVAKSYLIRSKSKKHGESREASPIKSLFSPGGTERRVEEGGEEDVRHLTQELLDLKSRYMASTQHWLKTDIVNDEELRMIRAQVFEAIQRKRSELHTEAAAVLRAESVLEESLRLQHSGGSNSKSSRGCGDGDSGAGGWGSSAGGGGGGLSSGNASTSGKDENKAAADAAAAAVALREEEEANRTIAMLEGTAEFLKFSRLLLLLSEAISVSNSVTSTNEAAAAATDGATSNRRNAGGGGGGGSQSTAEEDLALTKSKMPPPPPVAPGAAGAPEILTAVARARGSGRKRR